MNRAFASTIFAAATIAVATDAGPAHPADSGDGTRDCLKRIAVSGQPHRISSVAGLNAMRAWTQAARKHGEIYAMWHNAGGSSLKCARLGNSGYHKCTAAGAPCRASGRSRPVSHGSAR